MTRKVVRLLFLFHRYLGIGLGLLMLLWCLSGIVMMYVSYPELSEDARIAHLPEIDWRTCCAQPHDLSGDQRLIDVQAEMLGSRLVLRINPEQALEFVADAATGASLQEISQADASSVAASFAERMNANAGSAPSLNARIDRDQWTVSGEFNGDRPLFLYELNDGSGTRIYVSNRSGKAVQRTDAQTRFWNWLGAVPHWLYLTELRQNVFLWSQIVIWSSLLGCFLTATGLYIGIRQYRRRQRPRYSPYRGFVFWHHVPGLVFGLLVLTWTASGFFSMNPFGMMLSEGAAQERRALRGQAPLASQTIAALSAIARNPALQGAVSVATAPLHGRLFLLASFQNGSRLRFDAQGRAAPLTQGEHLRIAETLGAKPGDVVLLNADDAYYYRHHSNDVRFPVLRVIARGENAARYYIDPVSGAVLRKVDNAGYWFRWLHNGLHRLDLFAALRTRPLWDFVMLLLLAGAGFVCATGAYMGLARAFGRPVAHHLPRDLEGSDKTDTADV